MSPQHSASCSLTGLQRSVLEFERHWRGRAEVKEEAVREQLGLSPVRYQQILHGLLDDPEALRAEPMLVHRLLRARDQRRAAGGR